jgi:molecular chaperone DnaK
MVKDAEANAEADKKRRELVEARNQADALVHATEQQLSEHGDKIGETEKNAIETAVTELKEVKEGEDVEAINAKTQALAQAAMKLGEAAYQSEQQAGGDAGGEAEGDASSGAEDVVDAEFEEVDDDKKSGTGNA